MARREMTGEEMIAFLKQEGFTEVADDEANAGWLKGSFDWPSCLKSPKRKPGRKITVKKKASLKSGPKRATV